MPRTRKPKPKRDVEKDYPLQQFVAKLRRLADCLEQGTQFRIQIAGERVAVPPDVVINVEHERGATEEEVEFQLRWKLAPAKVGRRPEAPRGKHPSRLRRPQAKEGGAR